MALLPFERLSDISVRELRNTNTDLKLPRLTASSGQKCFAYIGAQSWNKLNFEVRTATTVSRSKSLITAASNIFFFLIFILAYKFL